MDLLDDEVNNLKHPTIANILYVDLKRLAKTDLRAGELAGVLIGTVETPKDPMVGQILQSLKHSFDDFKENTKGA